MGLDWIAHDPSIVWWVGALSVLMFVGTLIALPILVTRMPADYFVNHRSRADRLPKVNPVVRWTVVILKNLVGIVLLIAGLAMLVLPGQGLLAMLIGITLIDFPGKRRFETWLIRKPAIHRAVNWIRRKRGREPLVLPE